MKIEWVSYFFFGLAAVIHILFFVIESYFFQKQNGFKIFKVKQEDHEVVKIWAFNMGFYNLFLALGMILGLYFVNQLEIRIAGILVSFFGFCMLTAGAVLFLTQPKLHRGALIQLMPPLLGFIFLAFHIIEKISLKS